MDQKSFLFAYEDFKTYRIFKKVENIAAFLTERFFSYMTGKEKEPAITPKDNQKKAEYLEKKAILQKNIQIFALGKYIEFSSMTSCDIVDYTHPKFDQEVKRLIMKYHVAFRNV